VEPDSYPPGPNPETERSQKGTRCRVETKEGTGRAGSCDIQRQSSEETRSTVQSDKLTCFYINARNVGRLDQFEAWVHDLSPYIIGVTESWANSDILDSELTLDGYDMFRKDRPV